MSTGPVLPTYADIFLDKPELQRPLEDGAVDLFRQGHLYLFDPMAGDQCHLTAYRIIQLYRQQRFDRPMLCTSFLINSCFTREKKYIGALARVEDQSGCNGFLNTKGLSATVKQVVVQDICSYIKQEMERFSVPLLQKDAESLNGCSSGKGCLYPKFVGVKLLMQQLNIDPVPVVVKIKVLCPSGNHMRKFVAYRPEEMLRELARGDEERLRDQGVLVVEGLADLDRPITEELLKSRSACPHCLFQHSNIKPHKNEEHCPHCLQGGEEAPSQVAYICEALTKMSFQDLLTAAGAAFTHEVQSSGEKRILQSELKNDFVHSLEFAEDHLISLTNRTSICMVEHMYPDLGIRSLSDRRLVNTTPKEVSEIVLNDVRGRK